MNLGAKRSQPKWESGQAKYKDFTREQDLLRERTRAYWSFDSSGTIRLGKILFLGFQTFSLSISSMKRSSFCRRESIYSLYLTADLPLSLPDSKKVECHSVMPYRPRLEFDPPMNSSSYAYYLNSLTGMANPRKEFTSTTASSPSFDGDASAYSRLFLFLYFEKRSEHR